MASKLCSKCKQEKPETSFWIRKDPQSKSKLRSHCNDCKREYDTKHYREKGRVMNLKRFYNITEEQFNSLIKKQNKACAICLRETFLCVDHDHNTGKVRGLLCADCNRGLGMFRDQASLLLDAADYILNVDDCICLN